MANELKVLNEQEVLGRKFKMYGDLNSPLFLAKDIAKCIEYDTSQLNKMIRSVDDEEKVRNSVTTLGGIQETWFLTEDGLYEVLMQSRKPIAKQFKKEVKKILKQMRLTGGSVVSGREEQFINTYFTSFSDETKLKMVDDLRIQNNKLKESLAKNEPYISFGKAIEASEDNIMIGSYAKLLSNAGISFGRNSLFKWLRDNGYLLKQVGERNNPREQYLKQGIFAISQDVVDTNYGKKITQTTKITGKGQLYLLEKIVNNLHIKSVKISNKLNEFLYDCYVKNGAKTNMELKLMAINPSAHEEEWLSVREMLLNIQGNEDLVIEVDDILEY